MAQNSGPGRSIFPRAPSFNIETFSSKDFIVKDFIETLSESAVPTNRRSGPGSGQQAFDPKPLIRSFEGALSQLAGLSEDLEQKESELLTSVRRAEQQHDQTLDTLGRKLDQSIDSFETLDISLNNTSSATGANRISQADAGGNVAVQIGEKLEDLDKQRRRALDANFLIQCWLEVSETGELTSLQEVRRQGGGEGKVRCAVIARQLMRISQRLDPYSWNQNGTKTRGISNGVTGNKGHNSRELIEKFSETLEKDLLKQFDSSYRKQNFDDMMECSKVLHDFNGGASVVALFVNQHQFFIDRNQLITDEVTTDGETWEKLADPDSDPPGVEPSLQSLVDEVRIVMQEESFIIKRAFPYYDVVLTKFIQRIFQQSIQQRLEMVLDKADTISSLAFLRSLHASRGYINGLVEDLKAHGLTEHPDVCTAQTTLILDQQVEELFVPYLVGSSYIDRERKSLEELYSSLLFKFTIYHSRRKKVPTTFMASLAQQGTQLLATAKDAYIDRLDSSELTPTQKAMMLRVAGVAANDNKNEIEVTEADGILSIPNAKRMLKWLAESVRRALELGSGTDTPKDVSSLLNLLLNSMGQVYVETALDAANDVALVQETSKTEPDLSYFPSLRAAVTITNLMTRFTNTVLIRLAQSNTTVRRDMEGKTKEAIRRMEDKSSSVIQRTVDVILNWITKLLAGQKKADFRPKDNELDGGRAGSGYLESLATSTCTAICTFLARALVLSSQALDGQNLEVLSSELAICIRDLLFEHFKKFQVNATGGLMVAKDMSRYTSTLKEWPMRKEVENSLDMLSEIGNLFIIGPEALRERSRNVPTGGKGKGLDKTDFRAFVLKRDDSSSVGVQSVLSAL